MPTVSGFRPKPRVRGGSEELWVSHANSWRDLGATHLAIATMNADLRLPPKSTSTPFAATRKPSDQGLDSPRQGLSIRARTREPQQRELRSREK